MSWEFSVGQKVVCTRDDERVGGYGDELWPVRGEIYTVRSIYTCSFGFPMLKLLLSEINNGVRVYCNGTYEDGFEAARFRPLVTETQSWLREILEKPPENTRDLEHVGAGGLR